MPKNLILADTAPCKLCVEQRDLGFDFTMAFQPLVDLRRREIFGYEALVRGLNNESAYSVISKVDQNNLYLFDQQCRVKAIALAAKLQLTTILSINFLPNAVYTPERCIRTTLQSAEKYNFATHKILFEFTEVQKIEDKGHVKRIIECYQSLGFLTAIDDFGAGHSGLGLLADFQPNIIKLDMNLIRNVNLDKTRQSIVTNCLNIFRDLNITPLAEGVETLEEANWLFESGIDLMQGYVFARPGFESLPKVDFSQL